LEKRDEGKKRSTVDPFWSGATDAAENYFVFERAKDYYAEFHYEMSDLQFPRMMEGSGKGKEEYRSH